MTAPPIASAQTSSTAERMLDVAERLAQTRGFNGFSYADIAAEVGVTKASLHYHFSSKAALGRALIARYTERFAAALEAIAATSEPAPAKLRQYVDLYEGVLVRDRMCLCGMFAAEFASLPESMQDEVRRFFDGNEDWLADTLDEGRRAGTLAFGGDPLDAARLLTAALEGSMLLARSYGDPSRFASAAARLLADLTPGG
jgi:TetR/AcrR family transcriptional regulator, transcriptional repressor for nem operon